MALGHSPQIVRDGLVLHLDAANPKSYPGSGTTWFDLSGNINNGTLTNGVGYNISNLGSLSFDGIDDYVVLPFDESLNNLYTTMSVWVKSTFTIGPRTRHYIFDGLSHYSAIYADEPNSLSFCVRVGGSYTCAVYTDNIVSQDSWLNIVGTYNGSSVKLYVNGHVVSSSSRSGTMDNATSNGRLMDYIGNGYETEGYASSFLQYNRGLSELEVKQNFEAYRDRYGI